MRTLADYHVLYLNLDVLILYNFFEKFSRMCLKSYGLDPENFYNAAGMAWSAALNMSCVSLELLDIVAMYTFFERGISGGLVQISERYAEANNKYCSGKFNVKEKNEVYLLYLDVVNLYGKCMTEKLPTQGFR